MSVEENPPEVRVVPVAESLSGLGSEIEVVREQVKLLAESLVLVLAPEETDAAIRGAGVALQCGQCPIENEINSCRSALHQVGLAISELRGRLRV